jgi:hypothetical protein
MKQPTPNLLPDEVAQEYELVNWTGGAVQNFGRFGLVNLNTLTLAQARQLHAKGFSKLQVRKKPKAKVMDETNQSV